MADIDCGIGRREGGGPAAAWRRMGSSNSKPGTYRRSSASQLSFRRATTVAKSALTLLCPYWVVDEEVLVRVDLCVG